MIELSIIIKALNEEANIARAIESALAACAPFSGEVIVVDSKSHDETVAIASRYPVTVIQIDNARERCCGIGPQVGFVNSRGGHVLIMDGDMELQPAFVAEALALLAKEPALAGVGGFIREMRTNNLQFKGRARRLKERRITSPRLTDALSGGGLYRRVALESVGYMSDRNLHAYEELDLGRRLLAKGWTLIELPSHAADHYSYSVGTIPLLWHRIRSGSVLGQGELIRAAAVAGYLGTAFKINAVRISLGVLAVWSMLLAAMAWTGGDRRILLAALVGLVSAIALISVRHRSVASGLHSVVVWHLWAVGMIVGLVKHRRPADAPIASTLLHSGANAKADAIRQI